MSRLLSLLLAALMLMHAGVCRSHSHSDDACGADESHSLRPHFHARHQHAHHEHGHCSLADNDHASHSQRHAHESGSRIEPDCGDHHDDVIYLSDMVTPDSRRDERQLTSDKHSPDLATAYRTPQAMQIVNDCNSPGFHIGAHLPSSGALYLRHCSLRC